MTDSIDTSEREAEEPRGPFGLPIREMRDEPVPHQAADPLRVALQLALEASPDQLPAALDALRALMHPGPQVVQALREARRWIGDGDLADGLHRDHWTLQYRAAVDQVDAALASADGGQGVQVPQDSAGLIALRDVVRCLRETGRYSDEEGEATSALESLLAAAPEAPAQADPCPGCKVGGVCRTPNCGRLKLPVDHPLRTGEAPAQAPTPAAESAVHGEEPDGLETAIDNYLDGYVMEGDDSYHKPTESERLMIKDAIMGLLADEEWDRLWGEYIDSLVAARAALSHQSPAAEHAGKGGPVPKGAIARVEKALADRHFRGATDLEDLLRMAANVIAEDGVVIEHLRAKPTAIPAQASDAEVVAEVRMHLKGWASATYGWNGDDPCGKAKAEAAHHSECIRRIALAVAARKGEQP